MASAPGNPGRIISFVRNFLVGRPITASPWLRTMDVCSTRSPTPPNLPQGPAHILASNYYCSRDLKGSVKPPVISLTTKLIGATKDKNTEQSPLSIPPTPGKAHQWIQHQTQ